MNEVVKASNHALEDDVKSRRIIFEVHEQWAEEEQEITMLRWFENVGYNVDLATFENTFFRPIGLESNLLRHD